MLHNSKIILTGRSINHLEDTLGTVLLMLLIDASEEEMIFLREEAQLSSQINSKIQLLLDLCLILKTHKANTNDSRGWFISYSNYIAATPLDFIIEQGYNNYVANTLIYLIREPWRNYE